MIVHCEKCHEDYDDERRETSCPHDWFRMHTVLGMGSEQYVAVTLTEYEAISQHFAGYDSPTFDRIDNESHIHTPDMRCLTPYRSGRLIESS